MKAKIYCRVSNAHNQTTIANRIEVARGFFSRMRGLLGRKNLKAGEGLLLWPCSSIHCFGMHFPIDVIFLDRQTRVISLRENLTPGSRASYRQARCVLELRAGEVKKHHINIGDQLMINFQTNDQ